jgi:hypothetical protein
MIRIGPIAAIGGIGCGRSSPRRLVMAFVQHALGAYGR